MPAIKVSKEQGASFVELFFDLVFVFAVTQVTAVLAEDLSLTGVVRALVVFWLVWWAWTQYTWSLNEADTEHVSVRLITLVATALAFLMAVTIPLILTDWGWLFPVSYLVLRLFGIGLQIRLAEADGDARSAVITWAVMSSLGLLAIAAAVILPAGWRLYALASAALLDVVAALRAGRGEWRLYAGHFGERHGLFVIIVLGESLIAAGVTASDHPITTETLLVTITAVFGSCVLWWTYFGWVKPALETAMKSQTPATIGRFARDVYSFAHFPLILGVIGFAIGIEGAIAHPNEPLPSGEMLALAVGVGLILGGTATALVLARVSVPPVRWLALVLVMAGIPVLAAIPAWAALVAVTLVATAVAGFERGMGKALYGQ